MGVRIDHTVAGERLVSALEIATSDQPVPDEWLERTGRVGLAKSRTFTPMLGTGLLAKASDDRVTSLSLKEGAAHNTYSARGIGHSVLVPFCERHGINLRTTGAEPLNNQPFFRYETVDREMKVRAGTEADLDYLVECLERADFLRGDDAVRALAAFLRVRILDPATELVDLDLPGSLALGDLFQTTDTFLRGDAEGGRRGQAFAAAALDLVYDAVETKRVHDPSRNWPGDVGVLARPDGGLILSVEVRQKPVSSEEILQFARRLASAGVRRGAVFALAQNQIDPEPVRLIGASSLYLEIVTGVNEVLRRCILFSRFPTDEVLTHFPRFFLRRMYEMECTSSTLDQWRSSLLGAQLAFDEDFHN